MFSSRLRIISSVSSGFARGTEVLASRSLGSVSIRYSRNHLQFAKSIRRNFQVSATTLRQREDEEADTEFVAPTSSEQIETDTAKPAGTSDSGSDTNAKPQVTPQSLLDDKIISRALYLAIVDAGFTNFTKVQERTIEPAMKVKNGLVCRARTGTGKTLAFGIPSLQHAIANIKRERKVQSVIITPTRDLALQIEKELNKIIKHLPRSMAQSLTVATHIGGTRPNQLNPRFAPKVLIATPGRLNANLQNKSFLECFSDLKFRVYDEADRLLDIGFTEELYEIDSKLRSVQKRANIEEVEQDEISEHDPSFSSLLFSATVDRSVQDFAENVFGPNYQFIDCVDKGESEAHSMVEQTLVKTETITDSYFGVLNFACTNLTKKDFKAILFLPTTAGVDFTYMLLRDYIKSQNRDELARMSLNLMSLHGKKTQSNRDRTVREFGKSKCGLLITTDVAARGLDFKDVSDVIQISPSSAPADYIHKIGRTARAGKSGKSILFLTTKEQKFLNVLKQKRKIEFSNTFDYKPDEEFVARVQKSVAERLTPEDVENFCKTYMAYITNIKTKYQLQHRIIIEQICNLYKELLNDQSAKMPADDRYTKVHLHINIPEAERLFDFVNTRPKAFKKSFRGDDFNGSSSRGHRSSSYPRSNSHSSKGNFGGSRNFDRRDTRDSFAPKRSQGRNNKSFKSDY